MFATSVRNKEVEFYNKLDDWWSPDGPQKQLHKFNTVRVNFIRKNLLRQHSSPDLKENQIFSNLRAIDIGCGAGILSESLGRLGLGEVRGIDPTPKCIELANEHLQKMGAIDDSLKNVEYQETTLEQEVDDQNAKYDLVCCSEVIEHVNDQEGFLKNCMRLVKPETGLLFVSSIAKTPEAYLSVILMGERVFKLVPPGTHEYDMLISPETVESYVHPGNPEVGVPPFSTVEKTGVTIANLLTLEMKETPQYLRANYLMMFKPVE